jgi:hypothetical protein
MMRNETLIWTRARESSGMLDPSRISYQWTLRQIGAFLDESNACRMTLVEVPDGFELRYHLSFRGAASCLRHFARQELISLDVEQERARLQVRLLNATPARLGSLSARQRPGGYQDFLRALGFELDQTCVYFVALDEVGTSIIVTYLYVDARYNLNPQKKMVFLKAEDKERVLQAAHARRQIKASQEPTVASVSTLFH